MKNKILLTIIVILFAGLYIDIRNVGPYCNAASFQPSLIVQSIIPFRADRETFIVGYGEKISNFPLSDYSWDTWGVKDHIVQRLPRNNHTDCVVWYKNGKLYEGDHYHYIDLKFWEKAK